MWTTIPALNQIGGAVALKVRRDDQLVRLWATFIGGDEFKFSIAAQTLGPLQGQALARTSGMPFLRQHGVSGWDGCDDILYVMNGSRVIVVSTSLFARAARIRL
ncbi:MAG TPA: hypothetical protein VJM46_05180 [Candidatus Saccharimonadales bacterium]|nr:hypothetical protein [Candidatus Saccharimonadales bacterium]